MQTVVAALDYTGCAAEVVTVAEKLAAAMQARLLLVNAVQVPSQVPADLILRTTGIDETALKILMQDAQHALEGFAAISPVPTRVIVREGDPVRVILDVATGQEATWLVLGTHGRKGLARVMMGSVAEAVLRQATVPVVTVRTQDLSAHPGPTPAIDAVAAEADG